MGFVCLCVGRSYAWPGVSLFVRLNNLCLAWGLSVCALVQAMFWQGVCLFVRWYKLCLAWGLSVCALVQVMFAWGLSVASIAH